MGIYLSSGVKEALRQLSENDRQRVLYAVIMFTAENYRFADRPIPITCSDTGERLATAWAEEMEPGSFRIKKIEFASESEFWVLEKVKRFARHCLAGIGL